MGDDPFNDDVRVVDLDRVHDGLEDMNRKLEKNYRTELQIPEPANSIGREIEEKTRVDQRINFFYIRGRPTGNMLMPCDSNTSKPVGVKLAAYLVFRLNVNSTSQELL